MALSTRQSNAKELRKHQRDAIQMTYDWMRENDGNPCVVLPTASGKSLVLAELCRDAIQSYPGTRILMLTHVRELVSQNAAELRGHWPGAPLGIYSAGLRKKQLGEPITFANYQSVRTKGSKLGHIDLVVVDECHLVGHKDQGGYRGLLNDLWAINPDMRVIGMTASPYRMGHGLITDKPAIFDVLIEPATITELIDLGYLAPLRSKLTRLQYNTQGVKKSRGEFSESDLQAVVDTQDQNALAVRETIELAGDRKAWMFFCTGVEHSKHIRDELIRQGIPAATVLGDTPEAERDQIIRDFKAGRLRALTNADCLTTGFNYPDIDVLVMLRPTMSASLYVQMAGRGMRIKSHIDHCIVLDFAGAVSTHGPITNVTPPKKGGSGDGETPTRVCPECAEIVHISARACPTCGYQFEAPKEQAVFRRDDDIMGIEGVDMLVVDWKWRVHTKRGTEDRMLCVSYYPKGFGKPVVEYFSPSSKKAAKALAQVVNNSGALIAEYATLEEQRDALNAARPPAIVEHRKDGDFRRVVNRDWAKPEQLELG